jgi:uncharacterized protein
VLRVVVDTNLWVRALLGGPRTLPLLDAWRRRAFQVVISQPLLDELAAVCQRPRLARRISAEDLADLLDQLRFRGDRVDVVSIPPGCRDPKDSPVLATAIDGHADAIVTGDGDLRADPQLRAAMLERGVDLWGVDRLMEAVGGAE